MFKGLVDNIAAWGPTDRGSSGEPISTEVIPATAEDHHTFFPRLLLPTVRATARTITMGSKVTEIQYLIPHSRGTGVIQPG